MAIDRKDINRTALVNELNHFMEIKYGEKFFPITMEQIYRLCDPRNTKVRRFRTFYIKKKHGGLREICAPCVTLNNIQYCLNEYFKTIYTPSVSAMGFAPGKSVVDNAKMHVGHNYVLNLDLKDFFPSINQSRVWSRLQRPPFCFNSELASTIAGLCSIRLENENGEVRYVLPQGAPTSPLLTNAICDRLDKKMRALARKFGLHYSRYADDMTFSSMHNVYQADGEFMPLMQNVIAEEGFKLNVDKTRLQKRGGKQEVTGITVNDTVNVTRQYTHDLRCILHIWEKYGYPDAYARFYPKYKIEKGYIKKGEPVLENVIEGKLNYLRMVKGEEDQVYRRLQQRYLSLKPCVYRDKETDKGEKYVFVQSYTIAEFEEHFSTKVELRFTESGKLIAFCSLFGRDKYVSISKATQKWLLTDGVKVTIDEHSTLKHKNLPVCYITLCRQKGKNFWLLTENEPQKTEILKLNYNNIPVDALINIWKENGLEVAAHNFTSFCATGVLPERNPIIRDAKSDVDDVFDISPEFIEEIESFPFEELVKSSDTINEINLF